MNTTLNAKIQADYQHFRIPKTEGLIALTLLVLACLKCTNTLPACFDGTTFTYICLGTGLAALGYGAYCYKQRKEQLVLITAIVLLALGISSYFDAIDTLQLSMGVLALSAAVVTKLYLNWKVQREAEGKFWPKPNISKIENKIGWVLKISCLALLIFGCMKLTGTLPTALDGKTLAFLSLGVGGAITLFNLYRLEKGSKKTAEISHVMVAGAALLSIGLLTLTQHLNTFQTAQALVGIQTGFTTLCLLHFFHKNQAEALNISKFWQDVGKIKG